MQEAAKRYYAEIMMPFRGPNQEEPGPFGELRHEMIAPSHGPIYDKPSLIVDAYKNWSGDNVKNEVVVPYISMHHSTRMMAEHFINALIKRNITVKPFTWSKPT